AQGSRERPPDPLAQGGAGERSRLRPALGAAARGAPGGRPRAGAGPEREAHRLFARGGGGPRGVRGRLRAAQPAGGPAGGALHRLRGDAGLRPVRGGRRRGGAGRGDGGPGPAGGRREVPALLALPPGRGRGCRPPHALPAVQPRGAGALRWLMYKPRRENERGVPRQRYPSAAIWRNASSTASKVISMSLSVWAAEMNHASYLDGAVMIPRSSRRRKKRARCPDGACSASAKWEAGRGRKKGLSAPLKRPMERVMPCRWAASCIPWASIAARRSSREYRPG